MVQLKLYKKAITVENDDIRERLEVARGINNIGEEASYKANLVEVFKKASEKLGNRVANIAKLRNSSVELVESYRLLEVDKVALASAKEAIEEENDELRRVAIAEEEIAEQV